MGEKMRTISAKISDDFYEYVSELAKQKNITISELIKQSILHSKIEDKKAQQRIAYELNRIGNNINQIARLCNMRGGVDIATLQQLQIIEGQLQELIEKCVK